MAFPTVPEYQSNHESLLRKMLTVIQGIMRGRTNNTNTFTLTANATTTTVTLAEGVIGQDTVILWMPTTANAAGALSGLYLSSRNVANNTITLTHANTAAADKTFSYVLVG